MRTLKYFPHILAQFAFASMIVASAYCLAMADPMADMQLVSSKTSIQAVVGEEDGEGLWVVTSDGTNYSVWTPEEVSLEDLSTFQQTYKNKEVILEGDVYKDRYGNLNLFVKSLPK